MTGFEPSGTYLVMTAAVVAVQFLLLLSFAFDIHTSNVQPTSRVRIIELEDKLLSVATKNLQPVLHQDLQSFTYGLMSSDFSKVNGMNPWSPPRNVFASADAGTEAPRWVSCEDGFALLSLPGSGT